MISAPRHLKLTLTVILGYALLLLPLGAQTPQAEVPAPPTVTRLVERFLQAGATQLHIVNITKWAFSGRHDSLTFDVNIQDSTHFRLFLEAQNMEILGFGEKLYTVNHGQRQIIIEKLEPHDLIKRFLGPLFTDVILKQQTSLKNGFQLEFGFSDPYSEWSSAMVRVNKDFLTQRMTLKDVEDNVVEVELSWLNLIDGFYFDDIISNTYQYRLVDLTQPTDSTKASQ